MELRQTNNSTISTLRVFNDKRKKPTLSLLNVDSKNHPKTKNLQNK